MRDHMDRKDFIKVAGVAGAAASLPTLFAGEEAFGAARQHGPGTRVYDFVSFSRAPATHRIAQPQIGMRGCGTFDEKARTVTGGGSYVFFDNASPVPKPLILFGRWRAVSFVGYDTKGLQSYGNIQPAVLEIRADVEGIGAGLRMEIICNVGALGPQGSTGEEEGWKLFGTSYGDFVPLVPPLGISHLSTPGFSIPA
jgi:hypothetical protein